MSRPLRVGKTQTVVIHIPSPLNPPKRPKLTTGISFNLSATTGPLKPLWESGFTFPSTLKDPTEEVGSVRLAGEASGSIHRAVLVPKISDAELASPCTCAVAFQDADGVELTENNTCVMNNFAVGTRQAVLSTNWVHRSHDTPKLTWKVQILQSEFDYGDIFVGLTEACSFQYRGRSIAFDVRGNFWIGWQPQTLTHRFRAKHLGSVEGASVDGTLNANKDCKISVTADLVNNEMVIAFPNGTIHYPLEVDWLSARLFVSFSRPLDMVRVQQG